MMTVKYKYLRIGFCACLLLSLSFLPFLAHSRPDSEADEERYIVVLSDTLRPAEVEGAAKDIAGRHGAVPEHVYTRVLNGFSAKFNRRQLTSLRADPRVNNVVADKPVYAFCHTETFQTLPTGVDRVDADVSPTANINNVNDALDVDIAILDTGIYPHQDLYIFKAVNCTTRSGCKAVTPADKNGHGTHVAGIAAAKDNSRAVVGAAPGARLWMVKVLGDSGFGWNSWIIAGIDYVTRNAASIEVANMSLGGTGTVIADCGVNGSGRVVDPLHRAICNSVAAGVTYAVAAGNDFIDASDNTPAAYPEAITVSALSDSDGLPGGLGPSTSDNDDDAFATFSNYGSIVDLIAPGVDIFSTWPGSKRVPQGMCAELSGTSMAAPHVAGAAALYIRSELNRGNPRPTPAQVVGALRSSGQCPDGSTFGSGPCATPWPGDPDGITEPLVNIGGF